MRDTGHHPVNQPEATPATNATTRFVDVHCHCLPNLDDGPESVGDSLALCRALIADHIGAVVASAAHHHRFSPPRLTAAFSAIRARVGQKQARLLCIENPARIIHGERLAPVEMWTQQEVS